MKERGIPFSAPMVRALLADTKTQTRRVVKIDGLDFVGSSDDDVNDPANWGLESESGHNWSLAPGPMVDRVFTSPYGVPGDRLWVREAWRVSALHDGKPPRDLTPRAMTVFYEAGGSAANDGAPAKWVLSDWPESAAARPDWAGKLRPGMFMPRWASRITLEVVAVRVERLRAISHDDACAEGIDSTRGGAIACIDRYRALWEAINGAGSWAANPFVWVVEFRNVA